MVFIDAFLRDSLRYIPQPSNHDRPGPINQSRKPKATDFTLFQAHNCSLKIRFDDDLHQDVFRALDQLIDPDEQVEDSLVRKVDADDFTMSEMLMNGEEVERGYCRDFHGATASIVLSRKKGRSQSRYHLNDDFHFSSKWTTPGDKIRLSDEDVEEWKETSEDITQMYCIDREDLPEFIDSPDAFETEVIPPDTINHVLSSEAGVSDLNYMVVSPNNAIGTVEALAVGEIKMPLVFKQKDVEHLLRLIRGNEQVIKLVLVREADGVIKKQFVSRLKPKVLHMCIQLFSSMALNKCGITIMTTIHLSLIVRYADGGLSFSTPIYHTHANSRSLLETLTAIPLYALSDHYEDPQYPKPLTM